MQDDRMDGWCFQHGTVRCSVSLACRCCMCLETWRHGGTLMPPDSERRPRG